MILEYKEYYCYIHHSFAYWSALGWRSRATSVGIKVKLPSPCSYIYYSYFGGDNGGLNLISSSGYILTGEFYISNDPKRL